LQNALHGEKTHKNTQKTDVNMEEQIKKTKIKREKSVDNTETPLEAQLQGSAGTMTLESYTVGNCAE
jgi:hypothetical protein